MTCQCKAREFAIVYWADASAAGKHSEIKKDFLCPMCLDKDQIYDHHNSDGEFLGDQLECHQCHNYVKYFIDGANKEELYIDDIVIINELDQNKGLIYKCDPKFNDTLIMKTSLFDTSNMDQLRQRIKTIITFL